MKDIMRQTISSILSKSSASDPSRNGGYKVIVVKDPDIKIHISLVFTNMGPEGETKSFPVTEPQQAGATDAAKCIGTVILLPSFWLDKDIKPLSMAHIENIINDIYNENGWDDYVPIEANPDSIPKPRPIPTPIPKSINPMRSI